MTDDQKQALYDTVAEQLRLLSPRTRYQMYTEMDSAGKLDYDDALTERDVQNTIFARLQYNICAQITNAMEG